MALVTYEIGACTGGPSIFVDFDSSSLPVVGGNYYLTFVGSTDSGCYEIVDTAEPGVGINSNSNSNTNKNCYSKCYSNKNTNGNSKCYGI